MDADKQLELLLRGTQFPDEIQDEGQDLEAEGRATGDRETPAVGAGETTGTLRGQMTSELRNLLKSGRPLRVYYGADPTATSLHIGHFVPIQKLRQFQELGHQVVFLIGDYTALIGDPAGQNSERKRLDPDQVMEMSRDYTSQAFRLLDPKKTEVRRNSEWLSKLSFLDVVELATLFPLKWIISRRDFAERLSRGESLRLHETLYSLMQGYDAYALECDVQVGGYDQYLNMLAGRWIQEHFGKKPHVTWTSPLLMGTDGRKMSKSFGNDIPVKAGSEDMYGKCMRISDDLLDDYIDLATDLQPMEADALKARLREDGVNPMEIKKEIAANILRQYHGEEAALRAAEHFRTVIQEKSQPDEVEVLAVPEAALAGGMSWPDLLVSLKLARSKGEVRRLMSQGGFYVEQEPVKSVDAAYEPKPETLIRMGKRRYYKLVTD